MTKINELARADIVADNDLVPIWDTLNKDTRAATLEAVRGTYDRTLRADLAASSGSSLVGHVAAGAGAVARTVQAKLRDVVSLQDFGAAGDGATDDTAAIAAALASNARVLDGGGLTYLVSAELTGRSNLTLQNARFTAPALGASAAGIRFAGTDGTPQTLAANYAEGAFGMTVPTGSAFTAGSWAFLTSDAYWADPAADNVRYGELVQINTVVGNDLTFAGSTLLAYNTAANATITPITPVSNVKLLHVNFTGPDSVNNQFGIVLNRCVNVTVQNCDLEQWDHTHIYIQRSALVTVRGGSASKTGAQEGLDYGVAVVEGCYDVLIDGFRADRVRHVATIGGSRGVSRHITVTNCRGRNLTDAGLDSHSAVHEHTFSNNFLHFADDADVTIDGIAVQGTAPIVTGNQIANPKRHGIAWSPEALTGFGGIVSAIISGNRVDQQRNTGSTSGVLISPTAVAGLREITAVSMVGNECGGFQNHTRVITAGAAIRKVSIVGGQVSRGTRSRAVYLQASSGDIDGVEINGGHYEVDNITTAAVIDLVGTATGTIRNWRIVGPHLKRNGAGTVGIAVAYSVNGSESGSVFDGASVPYTVDANSTGVTFDRRQRGIYTHSVSTAYTVLPSDESIIVNRAATVTLTLPVASQYRGRTLYVKTIQAQAVDSASANVAPIGDLVAGTSILPATDGAWALLKSDGTNWVVMQRG